MSNDVPMTDNMKRIVDMEQKRIDALHAVLSARDRRPNVLTLEEFWHFHPLYQTREHRKLSDDQLRQLMTQYQQKINFFKPTVVIKSHQDPTVVLQLPQALSRMRSLSPTEENTAAVNVNYKNRLSDLPLLWSTAQNAMTQALCKEQLNDQQVAYLAAVQKETDDIMNAFYQTYAPPATTTPSSETSEENVENVVAHVGLAFDDE